MNKERSYGYKNEATVRKNKLFLIVNFILAIATLPPQKKKEKEKIGNPSFFISEKIYYALLLLEGHILRLTSIFLNTTFILTICYITIITKVGTDVMDDNVYMCQGRTYMCQGTKSYVSVNSMITTILKLNA